MATINIENVEIDDSGYPCSCGHCSECGLNFVPTEREAREWAEEDGVYGKSTAELVSLYSGR